MNTMIEEIRKRINAQRTDGSDAYETGQNVGLSYAIDIIDEVVKQSLEADADNEAITKSMDYVDGIQDGGTREHPWNDHDVERGYQVGFKDGILYERERLMKEEVVIDTDITINRYTKRHILHISSTDEHIQHLPQGDYKAIIIKKEK